VSALQQLRPTEIEQVRAFIHRVRDEPVWFAENVLNHRALPGEPTLAEDAERSWELDIFQREILDACLDPWRKKHGKPTRINHAGKPYITIRAGHGPGKTHLLGLIAWTIGTAFPARIIATAPKLAQLRTRLWGSLRKIHNRAEKFWRETHTIHDSAVYWHGVDDKGRLIEDRNWCILAETATQPENLAGHHERFLVVLVDESTGVPENLWPVIFGALSTGEFVLLVMVSNPTKITGTFAASHLQKREEPNYFRYHINLANARRISRSWVAAMERKYGADSPIVAVRCHGEFPTSDPNQLIALEWIDKALNREFLHDGSQPRLRVSVDVADGGENESVITVASLHQSKRRIRKQLAYNFPTAESPIRCADEAEKLFLHYGGRKLEDDFVVDAIGVGSGCAGELMRRGYRVVVYKGGSESDDPKQWRNRRVQSYMVLRNEFRDDFICFDEDFLSPIDGSGGEQLTAMDDFMAQLCSIRTKNDANGDRVEDLLTKKEMVDQGIISPDRADSLAMQCATQTPRMETQSQHGARAALTVATSTLMESY
jgi:hypothetical protein